MQAVTPHEQLDLEGGSIPLEELELAGHSRRLAEEERERGRRLTATEAGALVHAIRGKHPLGQTCNWCEEDGTQALITLNTHRHRIAERERRDAEEPGWTCSSCGFENSAGRILCGGCASSPLDDREPTLEGTPLAASYDPASAPFPDGF